MNRYTFDDISCAFDDEDLETREFVKASDVEDLEKKLAAVEHFKEELGRWKQHKWFWEVIDDLLSERTPQNPSALWVCSECGEEFDHRPGPHRVKYGGPLCDGTAVEKGSDKGETRFEELLEKWKDDPDFLREVEQLAKEWPTARPAPAAITDGLREVLGKARVLIVNMDKWNIDVQKIIGKVPNTGFERAGDLIAEIDAALRQSAKEGA